MVTNIVSITTGIVLATTLVVRFEYLSSSGWATAKLVSTFGSRLKIHAGRCYIPFPVQCCWIAPMPMNLWYLVGRSPFSIGIT